MARVRSRRSGAAGGGDADTLDGLDSTAFEKLANKDAANGYAGLDSGGDLADARVAQSNVTQHQGAIDHGSIAGLTGEENDDHSQYALLVGRAGGQTQRGGSAAGDRLSLESTSDAAKGGIDLGSQSAYDETNERLGLGTVAPQARADVAGDVRSTYTSRALAPADLGATPAVHYRPDELTTPGALSPWPDESGNANDATPSGTSPTVALDAANGQSEVQFNGASNLLSGSTVAAEPVTIVCVVQLNAAATSSNLVRGSATNGISLVLTAGDVPQLGQRGVANFTAADTALTVGQREIVVVTYAANGAFAYFLNGAADGTGTDDRTITAQTLDIASSSNLDLSEVLVYTSVLSTADRESVEGHLAWKYGLQAQLPAGHTYKNAAPTSVVGRGTLLVGGAAHPSAAHEIRSVNQGQLPPRMTTTQRDAITSPATGLVIYNTTTSALNVFDGTSWGAVGGAAAPRGYASGMRLSFTSVSIVAIGTAGVTSVVRDSTDGVDISFAGTLTAVITTPGAGGLRSAEAESANTWYAVFVIDGPTVSPAGFLSVLTSPSLPTGYTVFRRIGWVRNDGSSNFRRFNQRGAGNDRRYGYDVTEATTQVLTGGTATSWTGVSMTSFIPTTSQLAILQASVEQSSSTTGELRLRRTGDTVAEASALIKAGDSADDFSGGADAHFPNIEMETDGAQSIDYAVSNTSSDADIFVRGFVDEI